MASLFLRRLDVRTIIAYVVPAALWFRHLTGGKRLLVAGGLGAVSALAHAPLYIWPVLFFSFPALVWMIDGAIETSQRWTAAALISWAFGFGYFLVGLHWVGFAFVVDADRHAWLLPFVAVIFPGGLALFFAGAAIGARLQWSNGVGRVFALVAGLSAAEWLRGHVLTGFPWNLPGYVWSGSDSMIQTASVYGIYGLSLVTLLAVCLPAAVIDARGKAIERVWPLGLSLGLIGAFFLFGILRVPGHAAPVFEDVALRLVQPNVPQSEKWKPELLQRNWQLLIDLTRTLGLEARTHVIWPEAAPPFFLLSTDGALEVIGEVLHNRALLLTGTQRFELGEPKKYFNSMAAIDGAGRVLATYDKSHLVPFGEYLPLFYWLEKLGITQLAGSNGGFSSGDGVKTIAAPGTPPFGPLICYEAIFPSAVVEDGVRPQWLINMTDDSWFGPWAGPHQHLGIARVRAVEEGLAIARAANTGVSAVIDPYGRIIVSLPLDESGVVDSGLPKPLNATLFGFARDGIFGAMLLVLVGVALILSRTSPLRQLTVTTM